VRAEFGTGPGQNAWKHGGRLEKEVGSAGSRLGLDWAADDIKSAVREGWALKTLGGSRQLC